MQKIDGILGRLQRYYGVSSDSELSELIDEKRSTLGSWRARGSIPYAKLIHICQDNGMSLYWLLLDEGPMSKDDLAEDEGFVAVPKYDVKVSAGPGYDIHSEQIVDALKFKAEWLASKGIASVNAALVEVAGTSMEPKLNDGDLVLIDLSKTAISNGKAYVVRIDNELVVKYVQKLTGGQFQLFSENALFQPIIIDKDQIEKEVAVIGRVFSSTHDW